MVRTKHQYLILTFATTEAALTAESICNKYNLPGRLIPTPQSISAGCGLAWRVPLEQAQALQKKIRLFTVERTAEIEM